MNFEETMWAEMKPDVYSGDSCEEHKPGWYCFCAGDMDHEEGLKDLGLRASTFPPGTKVLVKEPVCPDCEQVPWRSTDPVEMIGEDGAKWLEYSWSCDCSFDWREWANGEYS